MERFKIGVCLILVGHLFCIAAPAEAQTPPISWVPPATFDTNQAGLGLPLLPGLEETIIYNPIPSNAAVNTGGGGLYESKNHGTFNHSPTLALFDDKLIVYWYNHDQDEDAPGQRLMAKVGTFNADQTDIAWGGNETLVELAGPPGPVRRRLSTSFDPNIIYESATHGDLRIINGRFYVFGRLAAAHGWTDDVAYHGWATGPVPAANWSDDKTSSHRFDIYHDLGRFVQQWEIVGSTLQPSSPLYLTKDFESQVEVTAGRFKQVPAFNAPYDQVLPLAASSMEIQYDVIDGEPESFLRYPNYAPGTWNLTEDGTNGMAHYTEFQRPDGTWVVVRDNLNNPTNFYAADKANQSDFYPLGIQTNLYGAAQPVSGELPITGSPWIIANDENRENMYLTLSEDGYTFDESWLLQNSTRNFIEPGYGKNGGAQYFQSVTIGNNIWVTYSVSKELIGVMKVPIASLQSLTGDFDFDGVVGGADFLLWQRGGSPNPFSAEDLAAWETNYGATYSLSAVSSAVPEPSSLLILLVGFIMTVPGISRRLFDRR